MMYYMSKYNKEIILYIEYFKGLPREMATYSVHKGNKKVLEHWDCFQEQGDILDLKLYNSGSGGVPENLNIGANYVNSKHWQVWVAKGFEHILKDNKAEVLKAPLWLKNYSNISRNPFKIGTIANDENYCKICNYHSEDPCEEHQYWDSEYGVYKYIETNEIVE